MQFIIDEYREHRGGNSRLYRIYCRKCNEQICLYQKDGPGNLRRLYLDRMFNPSVDIKAKELSCTKEHVLGIKILHTEHNEERKAYRLFVDAIIKQRVNLNTFK